MPCGIYIHIPFCKSRCSYCDFATEIYRDRAAVNRYIRALKLEIEGFEPGGTEADTIYFGGGTPSLLTPEDLETILNSIQKRFKLFDDREFTVEMNPATVSLETLAGYRDLGVNRASFGIQTFDNRDLKILGRGHSSADAIETFHLLREAGFENISFDLIAGLPGQTLLGWEKNLEQAIRLRAEHISLYLLEVHSGTPLAAQIAAGRRPLPDEDLAAEMYNLMCSMLEASDYRQYEISNFARPGFESKHNLKYWKLEPVFGFGVSAHSFDGNRRYSNTRSTERYVAEIENSGQPLRFVEATDTASEAIFLGLRLNEGINTEEIKNRYGPDIFSLFADELTRLADAGLIEIAGTRMRLTCRGRLYSNEVFGVFI